MRRCGRSSAAVRHAGPSYRRSETAEPRGPGARTRHRTARRPRRAVRRLARSGRRWWPARSALAVLGGLGAGAGTFGAGGDAAAGRPAATERAGCLRHVGRRRPPGRAVAAPVLVRGRGGCCARGPAWSVAVDPADGGIRCGGTPSRGRVRERTAGPVGRARAARGRSLGRPLRALDPATGRAAWERGHARLRRTAVRRRHAPADPRRRDASPAWTAPPGGPVVAPDPRQSVPYFTLATGERRPAPTRRASRRTGPHPGHRGGPGERGPCGGKRSWTGRSLVGRGGRSCTCPRKERRYGDVKAVVRYDPATGRRAGWPCRCRYEQAAVGVHGTPSASRARRCGGGRRPGGRASSSGGWRRRVSRARHRSSDGRHVYFSAADGRLLGRRRPATGKLARADPAAARATAPTGSPPRCPRRGRGTGMCTRHRARRDRCSPWTRRDPAAW